MPSQYAHYRFGAQQIGRLPPEVRKTIQRFRQLYDVGLHGPDLFFYHNIFVKDPVVRLGSKFHQQTGEEFFTRVCKRLRLEPSEAGRAYLYGVLAHFCLDSLCHPFIIRQTADGAIGHTELEKEFDRFLLSMDGHIPPHTFDYSAHMKLTAGECATVAEFYSPATAAAVQLSVRNMAAIIRFLSAPKGFRRSALNASIKLTGSAFSQHVMPRAPVRSCAHLDEPLLALYDQAAAQYPDLLQQLLAHLDHGAALGDGYQQIFH